MRIVLPGIRHWRHDLTHCLHTTMGVLLGFHGLDPLPVLGSGWGFAYRPGDVRREEYYFPCLDGSLLASLAPYHPLSSHWHEPAGPAEGWAAVRAAVAAGTPVAVAADNFHLPFRPAYTDVHTNHLLTVYGFDDERGLVFVADPVPPRFQGAIRIEELTAARDSANPIRHDRDLFFTANPLNNRWLTIRVDGPVPEPDLDFVRRVLLANLAGFAAGARSASAGGALPGSGRAGSGTGPDGALRGLAGQREFLTSWLPRVTEGEHCVDEVFILAGAMLASTGLHADFLADAGHRFDHPPLAEAGRMVDRVAHHWAALRIAVATARVEPAAAVDGLLARADALLADQERALDRLAGLVSAR